MTSKMRLATFQTSTQLVYCHHQIASKEHGVYSREVNECILSLHGAFARMWRFFSLPQSKGTVIHGRSSRTQKTASMGCGSQVSGRRQKSLPSRAKLVNSENVLDTISARCRRFGCFSDYGIITLPFRRCHPNELPRGTMNRDCLQTSIMTGAYLITLWGGETVIQKLTFIGSDKEAYS